VSTVELFDRSRRASSLGIKNAESLALDWPAIISRKHSIVESWSKGKEPALREAGIDVILGPARFVSPREIEVDSRRISAGRFVIATGSKASRPASIDGIEHAMISDDLLDHPEVPARVVIVGGGVIALELGFCFARAGSTVTVLQNGPHILPSADEEMRDALVEIGRSLGMKFHTNITVKRIRPDRTAEGEKEGADFSGSPRAREIVYRCLDREELARRAGTRPYPRHESPTFGRSGASAGGRVFRGWIGTVAAHDARRALTRLSASVAWMVLDRVPPVRPT